MNGRELQANLGATFHAMAPQYSAVFTPEAWVNSQAVEVDAEGRPCTWDCTSFALLTSSNAYMQRLNAEIDRDGSALDERRLFKHDPAAPEWVRSWRGPFTIRISRQLAETDTLPCIEVAGVQVYAYIKDGYLRVSVDLDTAESWLLNDSSGEILVPVRVTMQGEDIWTTAPDGSAPFVSMPGGQS